MIFFNQRLKIDMSFPLQFNLILIKYGMKNEQTTKATIEQSNEENIWCEKPSFFQPTTPAQNPSPKKPKPNTTVKFQLFL